MTIVSNGFAVAKILKINDFATLKQNVSIQLIHPTGSSYNYVQQRIYTGENNGVEAE